jgi:monothiol glutaredoxin
MDEKLREQIQQTLSEHRIVLYMKGSKHFPQCGFSAQVVSILKQSGVEFHDVNILADPELRQGLKEFSNWPTFPQLYIDGQLIGGSDIVSELHARGELDRMLGGKPD